MSFRSRVFTGGRLFSEQPQLLGLGQVILFQLLIGGADGSGSAHHDDVPAGLELLFMEAVNGAELAAQAVADHGVAQLGADRQTDSVFLRAIFPAVEDEPLACGGTASGIEPSEEVIQFQSL